MSPRMKFAFALIAGIWIWAFFFGNFLHDKPHANDMDIGTEVGIFRDVALRIVREEKRPDGSWRLVARTTYRGQPAGLEVETSAIWKKAPSDGPKGMAYQGKLTFRSLGEESNRLVEMLNDYYLAKLPPKPMASQATLTAFTKDDPNALDKSPLNAWLFYVQKGKKHSGDFYAVIDLIQGRVTFSREYIENQKPLLWALRGE